MRKKEVSVFYFYALHVAVVSSIAVILFASYLAFPRTWSKLFSLEENPITLAHRGASGYAPEHTMPAFELGIYMGADFLEIDVQNTKDGHLIAFHDETVERTTNGRGKVRNMTLAEIKALDAGSWFNEKYPMLGREKYVGLEVVTLAEIFSTFGKTTNYMLDIKGSSVFPGMEEQLLALVEEYDLENHVAMQSFSSESLQKVHQLNSEIPLYQLMWYNYPAFISADTLNRIKQYAVGVSPNFNMIGSEYINKVKGAGLQVVPYTVNYQVNMDKAYILGVNGIYTDFPDRFLEVIRHDELEDMKW